MSEQPSQREMGFRRAAQEAIHFAKEENGNNHSALGRMVELLPKYGVGNPNRGEIVHHFDKQMKRTDGTDKLYDE